MAIFTPPAREALTNVIYGIRVDRATATPPATTSTEYFHVYNGRCLVTMLVGEVTTAIQAQACNLSWESNPTTGTTNAMCAVLDIQSKEQGTLLSITGTVGDAMIGANAGYAPLPARPLVVNAGTIDLDTAASNSGSVKWSIWYVPLDDGAYVTAA
jgi:hypothetical protein